MLMLRRQSLICDLLWSHLELIRTKIRNCNSFFLIIIFIFIIKDLFQDKLSICKIKGSKEKVYQTCYKYASIFLPQFTTKNFISHLKKQKKTNLKKNNLIKIIFFFFIQFFFLFNWFKQTNTKNTFLHLSNQKTKQNDELKIYRIFRFLVSFDFHYSFSFCRSFISSR